MSTMSLTRRLRLRRAVTAIAATGITAAGLSLVAAPAAQAADAPKVVVSQTTVPTTGEVTITVTGTGFDPSLATGTRPPLAGQKSGVYIAFGKFQDNWKPSADAPSASRKTADTKWALPAGSTPSPAFNAEQQAQRVELRADGSFTTTLKVSKSAADALPGTDASYKPGIYTYAGAGAKVASYETATPITFADLSTVGVATVDVTKKPTTKKKGSATVKVTGGYTTPIGHIIATYKGGTLKGKKVLSEKLYTLAADGTVDITLPKSAKGKRTLKLYYVADVDHKDSVTKVKVKVKK